jgi:hypothetical protein
MRPEFDRLPEIATLEPGLRNVFMARSPSLNAPVPEAANDNEPGWPIIPFPDDWYATC